MRTIRLLLLAVGLLFAAGSPALAQNAGTVVVLDYERALTNSVAGRDLETKLRQIGSQMQAEVQSEQNWVQQEQQAIQQATAGQSAEQLQRNSALQTRVRTYNTRAEALRALQVAKMRDLEYTRQSAVAELNRQLQPIVREVMQSRRASVVLDQGATQMVDDGVDITADVIGRLDRAVRTVTVTRMTAPAQQQQR